MKPSLRSWQEPRPVSSVGQHRVAECVDEGEEEPRGADGLTRGASERGERVGVGDSTNHVVAAGEPRGETCACAACASRRSTPLGAASSAIPHRRRRARARSSRLGAATRRSSATSAQPSRSTTAGRRPTPSAHAPSGSTSARSATARPRRAASPTTESAAGAQAGQAARRRLAPPPPRRDVVAEPPAPHFLTPLTHFIHGNRPRGRLVALAALVVFLSGGVWVVVAGHTTEAMGRCLGVEGSVWAVDESIFSSIRSDQVPSPNLCFVLGFGESKAGAAMSNEFGTQQGREDSEPLQAATTEELMG